jgi:predicted deacylase
MLRDSTPEIQSGHFIPKIVSKPVKPGHGFKFALFAGIHGDEEAGTLAAFEFVRWASEQPLELHDYELHIYPVCNPSGVRLKTRHSFSGLDLNRQFWTGSAEPEIQYLESELRRENYDGIISLHSDSDSDGLYGFVRGSFLSEHLLKPALIDASAILPRNDAQVIDGFLADQGIIREGYAGMLTAPPEQTPKPLEIVFETPALAPMPQQVAATVRAVRTILDRYRSLQAYAPNL